MGKLAYYKGNGSFYKEIFNRPWNTEKEADLLSFLWKEEGLGPLLKRFLDPERENRRKSNRLKVTNTSLDFRELF